MTHAYSPALIRAQDKLKQVKKELSIKAKTCEKYEKEYQRRRRSGASADQIETMRKTVEMEVKLYLRLVEQIGRPATRNYAKALRAEALNARVPLDAIMKDFLSLFAEAQGASLTSALGVESQVKNFIDRVCRRALAEVKHKHGSHPFLNLQNAHLMAVAFGAENLASNQKIVATFQEISKAAARKRPRTRRR